MKIWSLKDLKQNPQYYKAYTLFIVVVVVVFKAEWGIAEGV